MSATDRWFPEPMVRDLLERYKAACALTQPADRPTIRAHLLNWAPLITGAHLTVRFIDTVEATAQADRATVVSGHERAAMLNWALRKATRRTWKALADKVTSTRARQADWDAWAIEVDRAAAARPLASGERPVWGRPSERALWEARGIRNASAESVAWDKVQRRGRSWRCSSAATYALGALAHGDRAIFLTWMPVFEAFEAGAFALWLTKTEIVVTVVPSAVRLDERRRLHAPDGPAFTWLDIEDYYWHGVRVPPSQAHLILRPETITCAEIDREPNAEVRRVMIERYGEDRYFLDSGGRLISEVGPYQLYRKDRGDQEPLVMVRLINATAEPDGTHKVYWLRVPPEMRDAAEAVAWTFGLTKEQYRPTIET